MLRHNPREDTLTSENARDFRSHQSLDPTNIFCTPINPINKDITLNNPKSEHEHVKSSIPYEYMTGPDNPLLIVLRYKHTCIATLHEKYRHLSFSCLQLIACVIIIPKYLGNIHAPVCPGCVYGKAYRPGVIKVSKIYEKPDRPQGLES